MDEVVRERDPLTDAVIGTAIEVHKALGPGLLESAYAECLSFELKQRGLSVAREVPLPLVYKGIRLDCGYVMDMIVSDDLVLELKAVEKLVPVHEAQVLSYLRLSGKRKALLINFHVPVVKDGIKRFVL